MNIGRYNRILVIVVMVTTLTSCGHKIFLPEETVPTPVVPTLPLSMAIHYHESLQAIEAQVTAPSFGAITVFPSDAQFVGFARVFTQMFTNTTIVDDANSVPTGYDGLLAVQLNSFEIIGQEQTSNPFLYRVEITYDIDIYSNNTNTHHSWIVTGEGVAYDQDTNPGPLMREASELALRDALSIIAIDFLQHANVHQWLQASTTE